MVCRESSAPSALITAASAVARRIGDAVLSDAPLRDAYRVGELGSGFSNGSGVALLFELMHRCGDTSRDWQALTQRTFASATASPEAAAGLFNGLAGTLFAAKYIYRRRGAYAGFIERMERTLRSALDDLRYIAHPRNDKDVDLISGFAGIYLALAVEPRASALERDREFIEALLRDPERELVVDTRGKIGDEPGVNLGVAHGHPGVLAAYLAGPFDPALVAANVGYLFSNSLGGDGRAWPFQAGQAQAARTAWCYGAPGVGAVLCAAAARCGDADALARAAAGVRAACAAPTGIRDHALCHGTAGLAASLWCAAQTAGDDAALDDVDRMLRFVARAYDDRPAFGYTRWVLDEDTQDGTFLDGAAGIAAVMLTIACGLDSSWMIALGLYPPPAI